MPWELLYAAFLTGLAGGVHCIGMCGGLVAVMDGTAPVRFIARGRRREGPAAALQVSAAAARRLAYHAGRLSTYALLGTLAGATGSTVMLARVVLPVQQAMYTLAAAMLLVVGAHLAGWSSRIPLTLERGGARLWRALQPHAAGRLLAPAGARRALGAGLLWGAVPCALSYTGLTLALLSGSAQGGGAVMLAFGLGTLPYLLAGGMLARRAAAWLSRPWLRRVAGFTVIALAVNGLMHEFHLGDHAAALAQWCGLAR